MNKFKKTLLPMFLISLVFGISACSLPTKQDNDTKSKIIDKQENEDSAATGDKEKEDKEDINKAGEKQGIKTESTTTEEVAEIITSDIDTSDWKTYRNEEYGFEFKYQPYWKPAATDVGINEENKHYLIDILVLNNYEKINKNFSQSFIMSLINMNNYDSSYRQDPGTLHSIIKKGNIAIKLYVKEKYAGYSFSAFIENINNENIELQIKIGNIEDENEALNVLTEILDTLILK